MFWESVQCGNRLYGVNVNLESLSDVEIDFMVWMSTWKGLSDVEIDFMERMSTWKPFQDVCVCTKQKI